MEEKYWGSFTDNSSTFTSPYLLSFDEVEKLSKNFLPASAKTNKTVKPEGTITTQMLPISYFETDPITHHNIKLVQYSKKMEELLHQIQNSYMKTSKESIPHLPVRPQKSQVQPSEGPKYKLTKKGVQQVLHKSVFTVCAHEGFDTTSESVLSVLVDVVDEMLIKFCNLLKVNTERELLGQSTGFTDAMERTLQDTGVNGVKELSFFYTNRVLRYNHRLRRQGEHLHNECLKATHEWSRSRKKEASSSKMMMQWDDSEGGESSGNEVNDGDHSYKKVLPSIESTTNMEEANQLHLEDNASILELEPGLRMLYTLEQQEGSLSAPRRSQQHILMEEDSESPASFSTLDSSLQNPASLSNNGGKKRRKM